MDDQATHSFVYPGVVQDLEIDEADITPTSVSSITIHGVPPPKRSLDIKGLVITPLNGKASIPLKNALTHEIPNLIQDIPTPEEVSSIPGLSHLAAKFPEKQDWPTILLIGRDCMKIHVQSQVTWSNDKCQIASNTPLGWVIMGRPAHHTRPLVEKKSTKNKKTTNNRLISTHRRYPIHHPRRWIYAKKLRHG